MRDETADAESHNSRPELGNRRKYGNDLDPKPSHFSFFEWPAGCTTQGL